MAFLGPKQVKGCDKMPISVTLNIWSQLITDTWYSIIVVASSQTSSRWFPAPRIHALCRSFQHCISINLGDQQNTAEVIASHIWDKVIKDWAFHLGQLSSFSLSLSHYFLWESQQLLRQSGKKSTLWGTKFSGQQPERNNNHVSELGRKSSHSQACGWDSALPTVWLQSHEAPWARTTQLNCTWIPEAEKQRYYVILF